MKKTYYTPEVEVVKLSYCSHLLDASSGESETIIIPEDPTPLPDKD